MGRRHAEEFLELLRQQGLRSAYPTSMFTNPPGLLRLEPRALWIPLPLLPVFTLLVPSFESNCRARNHLCASFPTSQITLFENFGAKLAVQERYNQSLFHRALSRSLQGVAERPLPYNYNVIQPISALSRR
jgi:hypothetical protein